MIMGLWRIMGLWGITGLLMEIFVVHQDVKNAIGSPHKTRYLNIHMHNTSRTYDNQDDELMVKIRNSGLSL